MKTLRTLLPLLLLLGGPAWPSLCTPLAAQEVIHLPEDGALWHTTLVLPEDPTANPAAQRLVDHFATSPRLKQLAAQTSLHRYTPRDPLFAARYAPYFGGVLPALLVQKADGAVIYKISGDAVPQSAETLAEEIAQAIDQCCPLRPRPQPQPGPTPEPAVRPQIPQIDIEIVPDIRPPAEPQPEPPVSSPLSPLLLLAPIAAAALGFRKSARRGW